MADLLRECPLPTLDEKKDYSRRAFLAAAHEAEQSTSLVPLEAV
jgi:hypothetical protein